MSNEGARSTQGRKSRKSHHRRTKPSKVGTSASSGATSGTESPAGGISSTPTGIAGQAAAAVQSTAPGKRRQQQIGGRVSAAAPQPPESRSEEKLNPSTPSSAVVGVTPSSERRTSAHTDATQRGGNGPAHRSAFTTPGSSKGISARSTPSLYEAQKAVTAGKGTHPENGKPIPGATVVPPANPPSVGTVSEKRLNVDIPDSKGLENARAATGQPTAGVAEASESVPPTSDPLPAADGHIQGTNEPKSSQSPGEKDFVQPTAPEARPPPPVEEDLVAATGGQKPGLTRLYTGGSEIPGMKRRSPSQLDDPSRRMAIRRFSPKTETKPLRRVLILTICLTGAAIVSVAAVTIVFLFYVSHSEVTNKAKFCHTSDCVYHASLLDRIINTTIDPCDDFSAFVCSRWLQTRLGHGIRSTIENLRYTWYRDFGETLLQGAAKVQVGRKPIAMYEMCRGHRPFKESQLHLLRAFLQGVHLAWPEHSNTTLTAFSVALSLAYRWQMPFWLEVTVMEDQSSARRRIVVRPGIYVPVLLNFHRAVKQSYLRYYESFYAVYASHTKADSDINATAVDEIRVLEHTVLSTLNNIAKSAARMPSLFSFTEVDRRLPTTSRDYWLLLFEEALQLQPHLTPDDEVLVSDIALFQVFTHFVDTYGEQDLKTLLAWQLVQFYSPFADVTFMTVRFRTGKMEAIFRPRYCAVIVESSFNVLVQSLATISRLTVEDRQLISNAFINLVSTAVGKVKDSRWMDDESKTEIVQKLALVEMQMWPPESLLSGDILGKTYSGVSENATSVFEYWVTSRNTTAEAILTQDYKYALGLLGSSFPFYFSYDYLLNHVQIALGAVTAPAYYKHGTSAMLYGGLGFLMTMQLVRSIDEEGLTWAPNKSIVHSILSGSTVPRYRKRQRCSNIDGNTSTFPEVPALEIAFSAFKAATVRDDRERLPLGSQLTEDKVFFLTLCLMTCATRDSTDVFSADCNKMVQNSEDFAQAYGCRKGSRMNPVDKCSFFGV